MRRTPHLAAAGLLLAVLVASPASARTQPTEWVELFSPDGTIRQAEIAQRPQPPTAFTAPPPADVVALQHTGPSDQRFDLVFVGDGYTATQLATFHAHAAAQWALMTSVEPFRTYKDSFNVWMVDVVSPQSGVDNDPTQGVTKNTALGMGFWCGDLERLLCVNESAALAYAANAPQADQVVALANSTKYGGAGGRVATASGGNNQSGWIAVHELGHSMGGLADEYDTPYGRYTWAEPSAPNISVYNAAQLAGMRRKWYQYLGRPTPDGGVVGAYEGAGYYRYGLYRPSQDSLMRTLGKPFNTIGLNAMIAAIRARTGG
ncbi:M64 family metallopeptidase [Sphaerisporangium fuscum]|uniref:M64 family metallopeptidase n=1 Tax=Sphaerisporangium fuscum TaxID=2835868 RepID=UPI001BDBFF6A|nr:M64 family metallopeptidase [Sphaerisporangium fuscum]